jgi:hypothetical protein
MDEDLEALPAGYMFTDHGAQGGEPVWLAILTTGNRSFIG